MRLPDSEATHLTQVLRLKAGVTVQVFDGHGHEFRATIVAADRSGAIIDTLEPVETAREPRVAVTLAQAMLKGRKFDQVVRDAVMLGVSAVRPLLTTHTAVPETAILGGSARRRWERIAVASAKQSGRAVVPVIESPMTIDRHLSQPGDHARLMLVEPTAGSADSPRNRLMSLLPPPRAMLTIGPEGGWSEDEVSRARAERWELLTLGSRTLRADAAPVAAVAILMYVWGDL